MDSQKDAKADASKSVVGSPSQRAFILPGMVARRRETHLLVGAFSGFAAGADTAVCDATKAYALSFPQSSEIHDLSACHPIPRACKLP